MKDLAMTAGDLARLYDWFEGYSAFFCRQEKEGPFTLKREHTGRVCENIGMLSVALGLTAPEMRIAEAMALLHDVGRFRQYSLYGTFNDMMSTNHALLGLREMGASMILGDLPQKARRLIARSIAWHNAAALPENEAPDALRFMRMLRDADKLDIWKVLTDYYRQRHQNPSAAIELGLPDCPVCSPSVIAALMQHRFADIRHIKSLNDFKLLQISWVFDLNFRPSFQALSRRGYIEQIAATLPDLPEVQEGIRHVRHYMAQRISNAPSF
jgi:hypothetical protein